MTDLGTKIENLRKKSSDIVESGEKLTGQSRINTDDLSAIRNILDTSISDEDNLEAIIGLEKAIQIDSSIIEENKDVNETARKDALDEADESIDTLASNLSKLKEMQQISDLSKDKSGIENTEQRIEELQGIREMLGGEGTDLESLDESTGEVQSSILSELRSEFTEYYRLDNIRSRKNDYVLGILIPNNNLSREYKAALSKRVSDAESYAHTVFNTAIEKGKISFVDGAWTGISMFRPENSDKGPRGIYLNTWADEQDFRGKGSGSTFFHEVGHMIDYEFGNGDFLSSRGSLYKALKEDAEAIMEKMSSDAKWAENFQNMINTDPTASSISDILEGITNGKISGAYGHKAESSNYWKQEKYRICNETFAHFFEASMGGSSIISANGVTSKLQRIKICFPKAFSVFEGILSVIESDNPLERVLER